MTHIHKIALRIGVAITVVTAAGALAGCSDSAPVEHEFSLGACELLATPTVEAIAGAGAESEERSVDGGGPESHRAMCSYGPAANAPGWGVSLQLEHGDESDLALLDDVWAACEDGIRLDIDGAVGYICTDPEPVDGSRGPIAHVVWGDDPSYYASIQVVAFEDAPTVADMAEPLRAAVRDLIDGVDETDFAVR